MSMGGKTMTSEALLRDIAQGSRTAFAELYRGRYFRLVGYATALLAGDRAAAEDAVDEAFLDVWRSAANFRQSGSADGWIRRIVRNKAVDALRKKREVLSGDPFAESAEAMPAALEPSPFDHAASADDAARLHNALACLSPAQREAVWLCYFEGHSLAAIAELSAAPENTIKTRLFHARLKLRGRLGEVEYAVG